MADYIGPVLDAVIAVLQKYTPDLLTALSDSNDTPRAPFTLIGREFIGILPSPPQAWVMPVRTEIRDQENTLPQQSVVTVKIGIVGGEPEAMVDMALDYVRAVSDAVLMADPANDWGANIIRVHPQVHDYGPLYERGTTFARFPEVHLVVTHEELAVQAV